MRYCFADVANTRELKEETLVTGAIFIGVRIAARLVFPQRIKMRGKMKLRILKL